MRQLLYVSESYVGHDIAALDRLMVQARTNNAIDGITGLLWTDGILFAQVIEGDEPAVDDLIARLQRDDRHSEMRIVGDARTEQRQFGDWSMNRPSSDPMAEVFESRMLSQLARAGGPGAADFRRIIAGAR